MSDTSTSANGGEQMRAVVDTYSSGPRKPDPITPDLEPWAKQVLEIDPIRGVPGNATAGAARGTPFMLKIDALPPEMRPELYRQLELRPNMPAPERAQLESKLVQEAIYGQLPRTRAMTGLGSNALPYHKEMAEIAGQVTDLQRKRDLLQAEVDVIARLEQDTDPVTGEMVARPVYRMGEDRRKAYGYQIADINRQIRLLVQEDGVPGIEGAKRLRQALAVSAAQLKRAHELRANEAEAQKRAEHKVREASIEARAEAIAKMRVGR